MLRNRSVVEIMVLVFTITVALSIFSLGIVIMVAELNNPDVDTRTATTALLNIITAMMGALFGLLAGKAEASGVLKKPVDQEEEVATIEALSDRHQRATTIEQPPVP